MKNREEFGEITWTEREDGSLEIWLNRGSEERGLARGHAYTSICVGVIPASGYLDIADAKRIIRYLSPEPTQCPDNLESVVWIVDVNACVSAAFLIWYPALRSGFGAVWEFGAGWAARSGMPARDINRFADDVTLEFVRRWRTEAE